MKQFTYFFKEEGSYEQFIVDIIAHIHEVGLTGTVSLVKRGPSYKQTYNYYTAIPPGKYAADLYLRFAQIAREYLDNLSLESKNLPAALKGAEVALMSLAEVAHHLVGMHVAVNRLKPLSALIQILISEKKTECCEVLGCSMQELDKRIRMAAFIGLQADNNTKNDADVETGGTETEHPDPRNTQISDLFRFPVVGSQMGGAAYGLALFGATTLARGPFNHFAVVLLAISRALWFAVIAANQGAEGGAHFKHSISAILADISVRYSVWLHSILFLTGIAFGMAFILGRNPCLTVVSGAAIMLSFFGILVCPISRNNINAALKQQLHWIMVLVLGVSFLALAILNWRRWLFIEKVCCLVSGAAFIVFGLFNARNIRSFHSSIQVFVEHRIWIEFIALELVFIVTFWTLSGIVLSRCVCAKYLFTNLFIMARALVYSCIVSAVYHRYLVSCCWAVIN